MKFVKPLGAFLKGTHRAGQRADANPPGGDFRKGGGIFTSTVLAAHAAEAAGLQDKFFDMSDMLFDNQKIWEKSSEPKLE